MQTPLSESKYQRNLDKAGNFWEDKLLWKKRINNNIIIFMFLLSSLIAVYECIKEKRHILKMPTLNNSGYFYLDYLDSRTFSFFISDFVLLSANFLRSLYPGKRERSGTTTISILLFCALFALESLRSDFFSRSKSL